LLLFLLVTFAAVSHQERYGTLWMIFNNFADEQTVQ
jgi:hypothetical protein